MRLVGEAGRDPEAYQFVAHSERFAAGVYETGPDGAPVVELDRALARSRDRMTADIAHELGHARLIGGAGLKAGSAYLRKAAPYGGFPIQATWPCGAPHHPHGY